MTLRPVTRPLDMVPMITVVLLLLFFFLFGSSLILQPGIKVRVDLPSAPKVSMLPQSRLMITVAMQDRDPARPVIFFNDEKLDSLADLSARLREVARRDLNQTVILKADANLSQAVILGIINRAQEANLNVVIATENPAQP